MYFTVHFYAIVIFLFAATQKCAGPPRLLSSALEHLTTGKPRRATNNKKLLRRWSEPDGHHRVNNHRRGTPFMVGSIIGFLRRMQQGSLCGAVERPNSSSCCSSFSPLVCCFLVGFLHEIVCPSALIFSTLRWARAVRTFEYQLNVAKGKIEKDQCRCFPHVFLSEKTRKGGRNAPQLIEIMQMMPGDPGCAHQTN